MSGRPPALLAQPSRPCPLPRTHGPYCQPLGWAGARLCPSGLPRHAHATQRERRRRRVGQRRVELQLEVRGEDARHRRSEEYDRGVCLLVVAVAVVVEGVVVVVVEMERGRRCAAKLL